MSREDVIKRYRLTDEQRQERQNERASCEAEYERLRKQIAELEGEKSKAFGRASRLRWEITQSLYVEDPIICEPHGFECVSEPPGAMSVGANIHIDDGQICYAGSIGRRSEFTAEELATYRKIKTRK